MWTMIVSRRFVVAAACGIAATIVLCGSVARAHEIGTTRVSVVFRVDRTYHIEIVTDAAALLEKLEASAGRPPSPAHKVGPAGGTRIARGDVSPTPDSGVRRRGRPSRD